MHQVSKFSIADLQGKFRTYLVWFLFLFLFSGKHKKLVCQTVLENPVFGACFLKTIQIDASKKRIRYENCGFFCFQKRFLKSVLHNFFWKQPTIRLHC